MAAARARGMWDSVVLQELSLANGRFFSEASPSRLNLG
jgi:hypothetical protein